MGFFPALIFYNGRVIFHPPDFAVFCQDAVELYVIFGILFNVFSYFISDPVGVFRMNDVPVPAVYGPSADEEA